MPFAFLDGVSKMAKNTGFVEIHGTQTGVTMVSSRSREAITNVALNPKWLAVSQWTAKIFTSKISRTDPSILFWIGYSKIRNYKNLLYVFCTYKKQYTCRKFWNSCFDAFIPITVFNFQSIIDSWMIASHFPESHDDAFDLDGSLFRGIACFMYSDHQKRLGFRLIIKRARENNFDADINRSKDNLS